MALPHNLPVVQGQGQGQVLAYRHRIFGSTGLLKLNQCQNDLWLTQGDPRHPVAGDARIVIQAVNLMAGLVYYEVWTPEINSWRVWSMPGWIIAQNAHHPPGPNQHANIIHQIILPNNRIANPHRASPLIQGYYITWNSVFILRLTIHAASIYHIKHAPRRPQDQYLLPHPGPGVPASVAFDKVHWGVQMNEYRSGYGWFYQ
jgi:hypothetical protein